MDSSGSSPLSVTKMLKTGTSHSHLRGCNTGGGGGGGVCLGGKGRVAANKIRKEGSFTGKLPGILAPRDLAPGSAWAAVGCWGGWVSAVLGAFCGGPVSSRSSGVGGRSAGSLPSAASRSRDWQVSFPLTTDTPVRPQSRCGGEPTVILQQRREMQARPLPLPDLG